MSDEFDPYHLWLGIPRQEQPPNHYRLLGLRPFEDNHEVISYALDQRSAHLRSFQTGRRGVQSQRLLNEVAAAGVCLLDPIKRAAYDQHLRASLPAPARPASLPVAKVIPLDQPASSHADLPIVTASHRSAAAAPPASGRWAMIIAAIATCGLLVVLVLVALGGWLPRSSTMTTKQPKATGDRAVPKPKVIELPENRSPAAPPAAAMRASPPRFTSPSTPGSSREAWLPNHAGFAFRRVGDQWIEFQRSKEYWFDTATSLPANAPETEPVELADPVRGLTLRLYDDRLELKAARQDWAVFAPGRWAQPADLPGYAGRSPRRPPPGWPVLNPTSHALVFCGQESVQIPVPEEICTGATSEFTLETWIRWDRWQPVGSLFTADEGSLSLVAHQRALEANESKVAQCFLALGNAHELVEVTPDRWVHLALHVRGRNWRLFQNGALVAQGMAPQPLVTGDHLTLGAKENGLCGMIRDFRLSRGFPYPARFTPPLKLEADERTLVQLQMKATAGGAIKNLAPSAAAASLCGREPAGFRSRRNISWQPSGRTAPWI
jgi:hypothetical protein